METKKLDQIISTAEFIYPAKLDTVNNNLYVKIFLMIDKPDFRQISNLKGEFSHYHENSDTFYFFICNQNTELVEKGSHLFEISFIHNVANNNLKEGDKIKINFVNDDNPDEFVKGLRTPKQIGGGTTVPVIAYP